MASNACLVKEDKALVQRTSYLRVNGHCLILHNHRKSSSCFSICNKANAAVITKSPRETSTCSQTKGQTERTGRKNPTGALLWCSERRVCYTATYSMHTEATQTVHTVKDFKTYRPCLLHSVCSSLPNHHSLLEETDKSEGIIECYAVVRMTQVIYHTKVVVEINLPT